jgi:hypothetical protein
MSRKPRNADVPAIERYQLKIVLSDLEPAIWRRVLVRADMTLGLLHAVIQVTMGWTNSHLHQFLVDDTYYADPSFGLGASSPEYRVEDENRTTLREVVPNRDDVFGYEYDFGDSWRHGIHVEKILPPDPAWKPFAECTGGARACPPENCGGPFAYQDLLVALKRRKGEEYEELMEWLDPSFDPKALEPSPDRINKSLRKLTWPRTTIAQLARVLMQRDGVRA